jgi:hypothetical protein
VAAASVIGPWVAFNAGRGVPGLTGNLGFQLNLLADRFEIGPRVEVEAEAAHHSVQRDRELIAIARRRFAAHPGAYLHGVADAAVRLLVPLKGWGDVSPHVDLCQTPAAIAPVIASAWPATSPFRPPQPRPVTRWRCRVHAALVPAFDALVTAGWIGLAVWTIASLRARRFDLAALGALPFVCVLGLCVLIQANTRYGFPLEALALGIGVPGAISLARQWTSPRSAIRAATAAR